MELQTSTEVAIAAMKRGFQAVPIRDGGKAPMGQWTQLRWETEEQVRTSFDKWAQEGAPGIGLMLGEPSGGLIDIDIDHPKALRLKDYFLPPTAMQTGRVGNARSHRWYLVKDLEHLPSTRRYVLPDLGGDNGERQVSVELRSTGSQTVIPPTTWYPKKGVKRPTEKYRWEGEPFGGEEGPAVVDGRVLAVQVATMHLGTVLLSAWPKQGSRHDAYLALAGGLLRFGDDVHPFWEQNLPVLISALADATHDEDGPDSRVKETMATTTARLRRGEKVQGFPSLAEYIGIDSAEAARRAAREVEQLAGFDPQSTSVSAAQKSSSEVAATQPYEDEELPSTLPPLVRNPMEERQSTWEAVDLGPYLSGQIVMSQPEVLTRADGKSLFYPGRVNVIFGLSESAKTWIALFAGVQEIGKGERVAYLDLEDDPTGAIDRLKHLGVGDDDIKSQFAYIRPETPLAPMQRGTYGPRVTPDGEENHRVFKSFLARFDPTTIIVDGMNMLYGLHGLDTNDATGTDVITTWLKSELTRSGRTTVIVIDHTGKGGGAGSSPIGAHHKIAMVQGSAIRADAISRPMPGHLGTVQLVLYKDRPGSVRAISHLPNGGGEQVAGTVHMDSRKAGMVKMWIEPPNPSEMIIGDTPETERKLESIAMAEVVKEHILEMFAGDLDRSLTTNEVISDGGFGREEVYDAWYLLQEEGVVRKEGQTRWTKFYLNYVEDVEEGGDEGSED